MTLFRSFILTLGLLCLAATSTAQETHFALQIEKQSLGLTSPAQSFDLNYAGFQLRLGEQTSQNTRIDLILGNSGGTTEMLDDTTGLNFEGVFGGLNLSGKLLNIDPIQLTYNLHYLYHNLVHEVDTQTSRLVWHELQAEIEAKIHIHRNVSAYACSRYVDIQGEILQEGTTQADTNFRQGNRHTQCAGIYVESGIDGYYGIELHSGETIGGSIYFGRFLTL